MTRRDLLASLIATTLASCSMSEPKRGDLDRLLARYRGEAPGAAVAVIRDGIVATHTVGFANLEERERLTSATNFRLASITKQFTAAAILLLLEDAGLALDDPIKRWLPSLPEAADAVTVRHLLTHTSGLIDYEDVIPASLTAQLHDNHVLTLLESQNTTYFSPGAGYRYSNSGYALLALIVEKVSNRSFSQFLSERIFQVLGMSNTVAHEEGISTVPHRAFGYSEVAGKWQRTDQSQTTAVLGDGGVYSSLDDLARWDAALYDERLLKASSLQQAFAPATRTDDPTVEYGFGWRITGESLWHSGETIGFRNVIVRYPKRRLTVIMLTNRNEPEPYATALEIAKLSSM
jgi:CubicO group peptidase (beta-lactamase class C family)